MEEIETPSVKSSLPVILIAAVVQGMGLYLLHRAIQANHGSVNALAWITALYAAVIFGPLSVQLLARYVRVRLMWGLVATVTVIFFYFGWHEGATRLPPTENYRTPFDDFFAFGLPLTVLWLLLLPFVQGRLAGGSWRIAYGALFANAWRNKLVLAEAALFTGLFWLLLELWQTLFAMLKIGFFRALFEEPLFVYPVTALTFSIALHLIGSIDRLTAVVLEQLLNVLKWLAIVAGSLLLLFTIALGFRLPALVFGGEHAIGATWLLWLVAVIVLLLNAAFRAGTVASPYPRMIAAALRFMVPLLVIVAVTAIYALTVRIHQHGITVGRVWGLVVAGVLLLYAVGYSIAAFSRAPWMGGMARVNVAVAIVLMLVITLTLTPALPPERLAANSQFARILNRQVTQSSPFDYLRFDSGTYGLARLQQLAAGAAVGPDADKVRRMAQAGLARQYRDASFQEARSDEFRKSLDQAVIYPGGRKLGNPLVEDLVAQWKKEPDEALYQGCATGNCFGIFVDLNTDGVEEFVFVSLNGGWAFEQHDGNWTYIGGVSSAMPAGNTWQQVSDAMKRGEFSTVTPQWKELSVGGRQFRLEPDR